jgi:DNA-binding MarR family transcriptional regulator
MTNLPEDAAIVKGLTTHTARERPLGDVMREAHRTLVAHLERALRKEGYDDVGAAHVSVLATVDHDGARLTTLVARGGRTKQATAELAGHLTARGYLELRPDPSDRRAKLYRPTTSGHQLLASCELIVDAYEKWLTDVLGESGVAQLRHALTKIVDHGA